MNYGGAYRNTPKNLVAQAAAENLSIVEDLIVNKEQRIPDIAYFSLELPMPHRPAHSFVSRTGISHQLLGTSRAA